MAYLEMRLVSPFGTNFLTLLELVKSRHIERTCKFMAQKGTQL